ncbi:hypothetical protein LshimejAT787_1602590 [Lyophyllum shimeji]|uniref:F-box domain-containing protein n=1 Tax=Lyophyllum shimeji TaxID=47721 RepID=A0A9P3PZ91_LYOSH|nr:hypothetical protein LshimejAT787_1602590 [Lyophyllum shimeji]
MHSEPALDALWCNQATLGPLIQAMPTHLWRLEEAWRGKHIVTFAQAPEDSDWDRFKHYARKVRVFGCYQHHRSLDIHTDAMLTLASYRPAISLLPVLREVTFSTGSPENKSFLFAQCLLSSTIQHVSLVIDVEQYATRALLSAIPLNCPDIKSLDIKLSPDLEPSSAQRGSQTLHSAVIDLVLAMPRLRSLRIPSLSLRFNVLDHISTFSSLSRLETGKLTLDTARLRSFSEPNSRFPSLRSLTFSVESLEAAALLVDSICRPLTSLTITIKRDSSAAEIPNFVHTLTRHPCYESLLHLGITIEHAQNGPNEQADASDVRALFLLPRLESLQLSSRPFAAAIDDAWLATAATTWPQLRSLSIRGMTETTLAGLIPLVRRCPLEHISVDATWTPFNIQHLLIIGNTQVQIIDIVNSRLQGDVLAVLRCLLLLFPRLKSVHNEGRDDAAAWAELQRFLDRSLQC